MTARAALLARRALEHDDYLLAEIVRGVLSVRLWWTMPRLLGTVRSWLGASITEAEVRRAPVRARALRVALDRSAERRRACIAVAREMGREERERETATCSCFTCDGSPALRSRMYLCPLCGNKRCPRATDHRLACTGSNEPGQPGSAY